MTKVKEGFKRCYHDHPPYPVADGIVIYGGSGNYPAVEDADVYIGFDHGARRTNMRYPWNKGDEVQFIIEDMNVPQDIVEFRKLLAWTIEQLKAGRKVHAGCIGGHGRTGLFFAALRKEMTGDEDATTHVRTNYCAKTVESEKQVDWLHLHFGINKVAPTKASYKAPSSVSSGGFHKQNDTKFWQGNGSKLGSGGRTTGAPTNRAASIWG